MKRRALFVTAMALLISGGISPVVADETPLTATEMLTRVRDVVALQLGVNPKLVELIMALEEEFDIAIPDEAVDSNGPRGGDDALTTQRLVEIVTQLLRKKRN